jgi:hypothetical protein
LTLFSLTPGQFESQAVENFGPLAKYSAFTGAIIIYFILYALFAILIARLDNKFHWKGYLRRATLASAIAYFILLIISVSLVTITEARTHTQATSISRLIIYLILPQIAFGFTLSSFSVKVRRPSRKPVIEKPSDTTTEITITRRAFLRAVIAAVVAIPIIYLGLNRLFPTQEVQIPSTSPASLLPPQSRSKPVVEEMRGMDKWLHAYELRRLSKNPKELKEHNEKWISSKYDIQNMHWTELQQFYLPDLGMCWGPACNSLKKLWKSYEIAGRTGEVRSDIAWNIRHIQRAMGIPSRNLKSWKGWMMRKLKLNRWKKIGDLTLGLVRKALNLRN